MPVNESTLNMGRPDLLGSVGFGRPRENLDPALAAIVNADAGVRADEYANAPYQPQPTPVPANQRPYKTQLDSYAEVLAPVGQALRNFLPGAPVGAVVAPAAQPGVARPENERLMPPPAPVRVNNPQRPIEPPPVQTSAPQPGEPQQPQPSPPAGGEMPMAPAPRVAPPSGNAAIAAAGGGLGNFMLPAETQTTTQVTKGIQVPQAIKTEQEAVAREKLALEKSKIDAEEQFQQTLRSDPDWANLQAKRAAINEKLNAMDPDREKLLRDLTDVQKRVKQAFEQRRDIDPNKFWNDKNNWAKTSMTIGIFLGGLGGSMSGQGNSALKIVDDAIARDIDQQKYNREAALADAQALGDTLSQEVAIQDAVMSHRLKQVAAYDQQILDYVQRLRVDKLGSKDAAIRKAELENALKERLVQNKLALLELESDRVSRSSVQRSVNALTLKGAGTGKPDDNVDTDWGTARTPKEAKDANVIIGNYNASNKNLEDFRKSVVKWSATDASARGNYDSAITGLIGVMRNLNDSGVLNPGEFDRFSSEVPGVLKKMNPLQGMAYINSYLDRMRGILRNNAAEKVKAMLVPSDRRIPWEMKMPTEQKTLATGGK